MDRTHTSRVEFEIEDQLLAALQQSPASKLTQEEGKEHTSFCKFQVGMTIPDLLIVAGGPSHNRKAFELRRISLFECAVLAELLSRGPCRRRSITRRLYTRRSCLDRAVARLIRLGLVTEGSGGKIAAQKGSLPKVKVISIEAKLRRWRDAICQARDYLSFSNAAFVALPENLVSKNRRIKLACAAEGIGLLAVNSREAKLVLKPKRKKPKTAEWVWLMSRTTGLGNGRTSKSDRSHAQRACVTSKKRLNA